MSTLFCTELVSKRILNNKKKRHWWFRRNIFLINIQGSKPCQDNDWTGLNGITRVSLHVRSPQAAPASAASTSPLAARVHTKLKKFSASSLAFTALSTLARSQPARNYSHEFTWLIWGSVACTMTRLRSGRPGFESQQE